MSIKIHLLPENHDPDLHQVTSDSVIFIAVVYDIGQLTKTHFYLATHQFAAMMTALVHIDTLLMHHIHEGFGVEACTS